MRCVRVFFPPTESLEENICLVTLSRHQQRGHSVTLLHRTAASRPRSRACWQAAAAAAATALTWTQPWTPGDDTAVRAEVAQTPLSRAGGVQLLSGRVLPPAVGRQLFTVRLLPLPVQNKRCCSESACLTPQRTGARPSRGVRERVSEHATVARVSEGGSRLHPVHARDEGKVHA